MEVEGFIKIQQIAEDVTEHPLLRDIPIDRIINYAQEFIKLVGAPPLYYEKVATVKIKNYRGELPCDFVEMLQVRGLCNHEEYVSSMNSFHAGLGRKIEGAPDPLPKGHGGIPPFYPDDPSSSGSSFGSDSDDDGGYTPEYPDVPDKDHHHHHHRNHHKHHPHHHEFKPFLVMGKCCDEYSDSYLGTPTYKVQGTIIMTSREHDDIEIAYRGIPVDENGWPMFPDNAAFIAALEAYIKKQRFIILFDSGQINHAVYEATLQDYAWKVGQAQVDLIRPTVDEMETITNVWHNLIPNMTAHRNGFATAHNKEYLRRH